jgi:D-arabinose 1-dehydrogenase-like Zn-dependent alcohol dehydrogenase
METNGNGYVKSIGVGVAVLLLATAIIGSASNTIRNSVNQRGTEVTVVAIKEDVAANTEKTEGIDVMAEQISDIKDDVKKILKALDK